MRPATWAVVLGPDRWRGFPSGGANVPLGFTALWLYGAYGAGAGAGAGPVIWVGRGCLGGFARRIFPGPERRSLLGFRSH